MQRTFTSPRIIRCGAFEIDLKAFELRKRGLRLKLAEQPFQILAILLEKPGELITRDELRDRLWSGDTFVDFVISELIPNKKVVWKVRDCNLHWIEAKKEWNNTEVVFEISSENNKTTIDFTHLGLVPGVACYNDCDAGWTGHVTVSLVNFINEGKGQPE